MAQQSRSLVASSHIASMNAARMGCAAAGLIVRLRSLAQSSTCCGGGATQHSGGLTSLDRVTKPVAGASTQAPHPRRKQTHGDVCAWCRANDSEGRTLSCSPSTVCWLGSSPCVHASIATQTLRTSAATSGTRSCHV